MLEQVLTPEQFAKNISTRNNGERVEFAVKFPGRNDDSDDPVWLPIDAKFPKEDYERLIEAQERADPEAAEEAIKQLEARIKAWAWEICTKYVEPPKTTDFAILFLPTEGLFAEVVRRIGLADYVQRECKVVIAGPTTLWSLLSSFRMGFNTLAIQKRSSEVWTVLRAVKAEFDTYGDVLGRVQKKLNEASDTIEQEVARRARAIQRKLRGVQELPARDAQGMLPLGGDEDANGDGEPFDGDVSA
jgi:DNA recombination protein RmuC